MKKSIFCIIFITLISIIFAFDWPQKEILSDSFFTYFSQFRGGTISTSLIFSESKEVKACDDGRILTLISEHDEDEIFESTLGNAVILEHKNDLITVYANLAPESMSPLYNLRDVPTGTSFGETGTSGWQEGEGCLEFQAIDTKNQTYINPRILMPRIGKEYPLTLKNVVAINKKGVTYDLGTIKTMPSGVYSLYRERQEIAMPYKSIIYVNGVVSETLSYDTLSEKDGRIAVSGKKNYDVDTMYPDSSKAFLGEITIPKGKTQIMVVLQDILGKERQITYTADVK